MTAIRIILEKFRLTTLTVFLVVLGLSCQLPVRVAPAATARVSVQLPNTASFSRLLLPAITSISLTAIDAQGHTQAQAQPFVTGTSSVLFSLNLLPGVSYTLNAQAFDANSTLILQASAVLSVEQTNSSVTLLLLPTQTLSLTLNTPNQETIPAHGSSSFSLPLQPAGSVNSVLLCVPTGLTAFAQTPDGSPLTVVPLNSDVDTTEINSIPVNATSLLLTLANSTTSSLTTTVLVIPTNLAETLAPTGLVVMAGNYQVNLSWNPVPNATGYNVYYSPEPSGPFTLLKTLLATTNYQATRPNGVTSYYEVTAINSYGESAATAVQSGTPQTPGSGAPTQLSAAAGDQTVVLSWLPVTGAVAYNVYRSTVPGQQGIKINSSSVTGTSFDDTGLSNGQTYYYEVTAVSSVESAPSAQQVATPLALLAAPSGLSVIAGSGSAVLSWNTQSGASGYNVYRSKVNGEQGIKITSFGFSNTVYTDPNASASTTYYYEVTAVNPAGESVPTATISVTPQ